MLVGANQSAEANSSAPTRHERHFEVRTGLEPAMGYVNWLTATASLRLVCVYKALS